MIAADRIDKMILSRNSQFQIHYLLVRDAENKIYRTLLSITIIFLIDAELANTRLFNKDRYKFHLIPENTVNLFK